MSGVSTFTYSQKGKRLLTFEDYVFQHNRSYTSKISGYTVLYWQCERKRDMGCQSALTTDTDGNILKQPSAAHNHVVSVGRVDAMTVRHEMLTESSRRPEAAPASLLNDFVTPELVLSLGSEQALKQAIQRRRRIIRPKEPETSSGIQITGDWLKTLDGQHWFLGETKVGDDSAYIFSTEDNLRNLNVSVTSIFIYLYRPIYIGLWQTQHQFKMVESG